MYIENIKIIYIENINILKTEIMYIENLWIDR